MTGHIDIKVLENWKLANIFHFACLILAFCDGVSGNRSMCISSMSTSPPLSV